MVVQIPYTWGYVDSINRIRRDTGKVVEVVSTWGNQKAISGGMGRVFRYSLVSELSYFFLQLRIGPTDLFMVVPRNDAIFPKLHTNRY